MYQITAVFNKTCLADVLQELYERKIEGITVSDVIGKGGLGFSEEGKTADLYPKVRIDIIVSNDKFKEVAQEAIRANTQDLGFGAGKMWVTPVLEVERIRTGEKNEAALAQSTRVPSKATQEGYFSAIDTPAS